jgi:hypothetical protein
MLAPDKLYSIMLFLRAVHKKNNSNMRFVKNDLTIYFVLR